MFNALPVRPIKPQAVTRCALSAQTLPTLTTLSICDSFPIFALAAAARNRAIFCCPVSFAGARSSIDIDDEVFGGFEVTYGPVAVKRVASDAERGMLSFVYLAINQKVLNGLTLCIAELWRVDPVLQLWLI